MTRGYISELAISPLNCQSNIEMISHSKPWINRKDISAVLRQMKTGMLARGLKVKEFETAISKFIGTKGTVAVGCGTSGLILSLRILDVGQGDEVILPTYVCHSVYDAVKQVGARPVLCDIGENWNMTIETVTPHISSSTKAIIVIHLFGNVVDTDSFMQFGVPVIEDCCQAFGAAANGKMLGSIGTIGVFSFHATKCLTTGEGGAVTTNDEDLLKRMNNFVKNGNPLVKLNDLQAWLGLSQLYRYTTMLARRQKIADFYTQQLRDLEIIIPENENCHSIYFRYPVRVRNHEYEQIQKAYHNLGIHVRRGVDKLLHRDLNLSDKYFPKAVRLFEQTLSLPIYPSLTKREQRKIVKVTKEIFHSKCN
ncbi:MAG: DegT/DnrJ/EryC1/StrS family aminotransferase [Deltaproteobacteria bacterium]|nr:DegT/DnrJ/EryC1/StrS family aminotransferase [Deltaproteobacteria bacterium]MBW2301383.1 DegT/DnrJ/EryC1/StrS family aminotransferase [Deltaproteobacteria bacterium]